MKNPEDFRFNHVAIVLWILRCAQNDTMSYD